MEAGGFDAGVLHRAGEGAAAAETLCGPRRHWEVSTVRDFVDREKIL
jgi:hypothetical protein